MTVKQKPILVIMARFPRYGRGKTRLAASTSKATAANFQRHALRRLLRELGGRSRPWQTRLSLIPKQDWRLARRVLPIRDWQLVDQGSGDLGDRMQRLLRLGAPQQPVIVIGSDTPDIRTADIHHALSALRSHDMVLGPTIDGGYWLIGWRGRPWLGTSRHCPRLNPVRWSTDHARADTMQCLQPRHRAALIGTKTDVDDRADLRQHYQNRFRQKHIAANTA